MISPQPETPKVSLDTELRNAATILDRARDALNARMSKDDLRLVLENVVTYAAELGAEREKLVRWHDEDSKTINQLVARVERRQAELVALRNDALAVRGSLAPVDGNRKVPFELGETLAPAVDWLIARVAELEAELYTEQAHGRTFLEQRNAHAQELLKLRPALREAQARVAELEARLAEQAEDQPGMRHAVRTVSPDEEAAS
jgi:chromosome segregation ATPase